MGTARPSMAAPRLSIIIPVFKAEAYLRDCLDSILSYQGRLEVVAVNDGSPDGCAGILEEYERRDPRLRVVNLATNTGLGRARNRGLDEATGEYIWFVDADDWLPSGAVEAVNYRVATSRPDVLIIDHVEMFDGHPVPARPAMGHFPRLTSPIRLADMPALLRLAESACTKVVRRRFLEEIGLRFPPGWYEDSSFSNPLLMAARTIDLLHQVCYCYRREVHGGITTSVSPRHFEIFEQYQRVFDVMERAGAAYQGFRPELFRAVINHYLVIVGNRWRLPAELRREFFRRAARDYRRWYPGSGYSPPAGLTGLRHRLVSRDAYAVYVTLRWVYRVVETLRPIPPTGYAYTGADLELLAPPSARTVPAVLPGPAARPVPGFPDTGPTVAAPAGMPSPRTSVPALEFTLTEPQLPAVLVPTPAGEPGVYRSATAFPDTIGRKTGAGQRARREPGRIELATAGDAPKRIIRPTGADRRRRRGSPAIDTPNRVPRTELAIVRDPGVPSSVVTVEGSAETSTNWSATDG